MIERQTEAKTFAEYFAGIGLMRLGLEQAGWSIRYANDIDVDKRDMYHYHFKDLDEHFVLDDIHNLTASENVAGFLTSHGGEDIRVALDALNQLGYGVDVLVLDAERFVPQSRVRLFVVGSRLEPAENLEIAEPTSFYESAVRPKAVAQFIFDHPEIDWNIRELPNPPKRTHTLADIIENLPDDSDFWWSGDRVEYLVSQMSSRHSATLETMRVAPSW